MKIAVAFLELLLVLTDGRSTVSAATVPLQENVPSLGTTSNSTEIIFVGLPTADLKLHKDDYMCAVHTLQRNSNWTNGYAVPTSYVTSLEYSFDKSVVHHFLLYGCSGSSEYFSSGKVRNCHTKGQGPICKGRKQIPIGISDSEKKSNSSRFPAGTAYGIGSEFDILFLLLEVHFIDSPRDSLSPIYGVKLHTSKVRPKFLAGMLVMAGAGFQIPPGREKFSIDVNCRPEISRPIHPYAYWVHTHRLGRVVSGYKIDKKSGAVSEIARWSHFWPQPVILTSSSSESNGSRSINPGDFLAAKCTFNSSLESSPVNWGSRKDSDEMCDLFLFFYSESQNLRDLSLTCVNQRSIYISRLLPKTADSLVGLQNPLLSQKLRNTNTYYSTSRSLSRSSNNRLSVKTNNVNQTFLICYMYRQLGIESCPFQ